MSDQLSRNDVPRDETWNLSDLFRDREAWLDAYQAVHADLPSLGTFRGRVVTSPADLRAALEADERLQVRLRRVAAYAMLRLAVDQGDPECQADASRIHQLASEVERERTFLSDEILALEEGTVASWLRSEPGLAPFDRFLDGILRDKPYRLSPGTEAVLASFGEAFEAPFTLYQRTTGADVRFEPATDGQGRSHAVSMGRQMFTFSPSPDTRLRREAYRSIAQGFTPYRHTLATTLATFVRNGVVEAQVRGFPSAIDMDLHHQEVRRPAFEAVVDTISSELAPHMRRYARLQQRVLGVERVRIADIDAGWPGGDDAMSFEQAREAILSSTARMGGAYRGVIERAFAERWVDRADNAGRRGGAFCNAVYGVHPYVFASWTGGLRGAFILTHELGHAVQGQLAMENQPLARSRPSLFAIEAPSTFNELLLADHLLAASTDPAYRRRVVKAHMATFYRNFVVHLQKAQLQRRLYALAERGEAVTADLLDELEMAILRDFWGDSVELVDEDRTIWMHEAHYYMGMYPYTYAAGLSAAVAMFARVRDEGEAAVERWLAFLEAGGAAPPLELFAGAGIDMASPDTLRSAVRYVGELIDELEGEPGVEG